MDGAAGLTSHGEVSKGKTGAKRPFAATQSGSGADGASGASAAEPPLSYERAPAASTAARAHDAQADVRIGMWQRSTKRKLAGKMAPLKADLATFLAANTDCEVYTGQDVVNPVMNGSVGRVTVWHKSKRQKLSGKDAPEAGGLLQWLGDNPDYEVFCGQLGKPLAKPAAVRPPGPAEKRVEIWNRKLGRRLAGNVAPYRKNLEKYLLKHPDCELYTNQEETHRVGGGGEVSDQDSTSDSDLSGSEGSDDESEDDADLSPQQRRVTLWNCLTKKKITGNNAPMAKNVSACLKRHPDWTVYNGQDGKRKSNGGNGLGRPKSSTGGGSPKGGVKPFARMGTFDLLGNDMLVVRTEDSDSPVPYYLGLVHKTHRSKAKPEHVPVQWIMPEFERTGRKNRKYISHALIGFACDSSVSFLSDSSCFLGQ